MKKEKQQPSCKVPASGSEGGNPCDTTSDDALYGAGNALENFRRDENQLDELEDDLGAGFTEEK